MKTFYLGAALILASTPALHANEFEGAMRSFVDQNVSFWANDPVLVAAIRAQNAQTAGYDQAKIDEMDQLWRGSAAMGDAEIITKVTGNAAADFLRAQVAGSAGAITEIFVMDGVGLNVAATEPTSDYWQGDEDKFTATYLVGPSAVHFGEPELDDSTKLVQSQVSMTVVDPATGEAVGAITVGINLTALM